MSDQDPYGSRPPNEGSPYDRPPGSGGPEQGPPSGGSPYDNPPPPGGQSPYGPPPGYPGSDPGYPSAGPGPGYGAPDPRLAGMPPLAGLGKRLLARIIDYLIIYIPVSVLATIFGGFRHFDDANDVGGGWGWGLIGLVAYVVYEGMMLTRSGQTVGKKLMKIRVAMLENGAVPAGNPGWVRAAVYSLPQVVPCLGTLFWLYNVLSCTWDKPYRQCVHDKVAKTVVVEAAPARQAY
ncbi:hypothetical protein SRB5_41350 [Streptomyces sp. RB5]|uniref:RDD domain-containing protein n=1 Tax=Streptomyces smaragdinus TaxID=2585196 RepID=A0A7K0CKE2_9ACTN|nr:RDD family protein [Streptomyces smaragdinus]MQY13975.1 hypothetical protein [Streptomyces smaragdinus]